MLSEREMVGNSKQEDARSEPGKTGKEGTEKEQSKPDKKQEDARSMSGMTGNSRLEEGPSGIRHERAYRQVMKPQVMNPHTRRDGTCGLRRFRYRRDCRLSGRGYRRCDGPL